MKTTARIRILHVEDAEDECELIRRHLRGAGCSFELVRVDSLDTLKKALQGGSWDVVLADYSMPLITWDESLDAVRNFDSILPYLLVTGAIGEERAVEVMRAGAKDCILKSHLSRLLPAVEREIDAAQDRRAGAQREQSSQNNLRLKALGQLAGGVAHDFNNMLTAILGFATEARDSLESPTTAHQDLTEVISAAETASELTGQLLSFARQKPIQPVTCELNSTADGLLRMLQSSLGRVHQIQLEHAPGDLDVVFDPGQFEQLLINLLMNARDAMDEPGLVRIILSRSGNSALVSVSDTGRGMAADVAERCFDPFFSTKGAQGTGLGLANCYGIVQQAGGSIHINSEPDYGTTFRLTFPLETKGMVRRVAVSAERMTPRPRPRVLVVEDTTAIRRLIVRGLEHIGIEPVEFGSAEEAVASLDSLPDAYIDAAILDVSLPGMSGAMLAQHVLKAQPELPILFMSGQTGDEQLQELLSVSNRGFIPKPFHVANLLEQLVFLSPLPVGSVSSVA
ncbi:MAG: two-component system cell cycle sensor histidine kinase/response regulator CckA [Planctomycetota bacterium]|jgi:two-component system cell cycle sensor histidine kinase/response regulator CckA